MSQKLEPTASVYDHDFSSNNLRLPGSGKKMAENMHCVNHDETILLGRYSSNNPKSFDEALSRLSAIGARLHTYGGNKNFEYKVKEVNGDWEVSAAVRRSK